MPSFFDGMFAVAGVAAAAGPVIIHLLNRRRFRTVHWAAMDFLREAMRRSRRILQIRDSQSCCHCAAARPVSFCSAWH